MENEKLKNQKIEGENLDNVAGGAYIKTNYCTPNDPTPPKNQGSLFVDDEELEMIKETGLLNEDGHIYEENLIPAQIVACFKPRRINSGKNKIIIDVK